MNHGESAPKLYGSTTVGERGQIVIPAEARKDFNIKPSDKLLVIGNMAKGGIILAKPDVISKHISEAVKAITSFEEMLEKE